MMANITPERRARLLALLEEIRGDIKSDVDELDGKPFTGRVVAEAHGNLSAIVLALAGILTEVIEPATHIVAGDRGDE